MSVITRNRRAMFVAALVTCVVTVGALVVTLGVLSGARAVTNVADGPSPSASASASAMSSQLLAASAATDAASAPASVGPSPAAPTQGSATGPAAGVSPTATPHSSAAATSTHKAATTKTATTALPPRSGNDRRVTFVNKLKQTIWVAGWQQTAKPALKTSGWVLPAGKSVTITVPDKWNGRFWGRTGCKFTSGGKGHCVTGDCAGVFQCKGYGSLPASLAEYNFNAWMNLDFYDVSLVDGSNLPMYINHTGGSTKDVISSAGCSKAGCTSAVRCPKVLSVDGGNACASPCLKLGGAQYCCQAQWAPRSACDPTKWPVDYAAIFKKAEPFAYSYVDDDATSTFTCKGRCDYRITFGLTPKK